MKSTENVNPDFKALRERAGLTLEELARQIDYSPSAVNGLENNGTGGKRLRQLVLVALGGSVPGETALGAVTKGHEKMAGGAGEAALATERARVAEEKLARVYDMLAEILQVLKGDPAPGGEATRTQLRDIESVSLPIFGTIPAGWPQNFDGLQEAERHVQVPRRRFPEGAFGLHVRGDSMNAAARHPILDGETVILVSPKQRAPRHNDIVAALCDGQTTLKRLQCPPDQPHFLRAESNNPAFGHDFVPRHELTIQGIVIGKL